MNSVILFYLIVAVIIGLEYEYFFYKGYIKTLLKEDAELMENFFSINWESNWWHLYFFILAIFWLPGLLMSPFMINHNHSEDES